MTAADSKFQDLVTDVQRAYIDEPDPISMEPYYERVLEYIEQNPAERQTFIRTIVEIVENPREELVGLIQYCMHVLRWDDVRSAVQQKRNSVELSLTQKWMDNILESFTDQWHGIRYYDRYRSS
jgi:hypothetical protein